MNKQFRIPAILISIIGLVAIVMGGAFLFQGFEKNNMITERMRVEKVTLAVDPNNPQQVTAVDSGDDAQKAADLISTHRRAIAPTYQDLLGGGKFDPTNPKNLTYAQAMNLENYLYLAVMAFGVVQIVLATGGFMIITGIALILVGMLFMRLPLKAAAPK